MKRLIYSTLALLLFGLILTSCDRDNKEKPSDQTPSRVIFVYMVAENNLTNIATIDIEEMLEGCTFMSDNDRLVVYLDDARSGKLPCFYEITNKTEADRLNELTPVHTFDQDDNSASPYILEKALRYVYDKYHADSYGIVFWSHASGWTPSNYGSESNIRKPIFTSFGVDTGNNSSYSSWGYQMNIDNMAQILNKFHDIDFLMFDACFMQTIEAAYELRNTARYILASPAEIPGPGAPYNLMIQPMFADSLDMEQVMNAYFTYYKDHLDYGALLSVVDCAELDNFANVHGRMLNKYADNLSSINFKSILNYFQFDKWHYMTDIPDCYDMKGVMQKIITEDEDLQEWLAAYKLVLPHSCNTDIWYTDYAGGYMYVDPDQYSGMSMYVEQDKYKGHHFYEAYHQMAWAKAIGHKH